LRILKALSAILLSAGLLALWGCGKDKPTQPTGPVSPKDYPVYFYDLIHDDGNWYFAYHPATNHLDSLWLPYADPPVISADGHRMYVRDRTRGRVAVVELDSFTVVDQLPYSAPVAVSPDNKLIAMSENGLFILRTSDYSVVFHDTTLGGGIFSGNSQRFYGLPTDGGILRVDLSDSLFSATRFQLPFGAVRDIEPSVDETKLFLYLHRYGFNHHFAVYEIASDSLIFTEYLWPGFGKLAVTPDSRYVFYTNPGTMLGPTPGPPWITVFDVERNMIDRHITTAGLLDEPYQYGMPLGEVCITPDGRWLVALPAKSFPFVFAVDVHRMNVSSNVKLGHYLLEGLACQNGR
jgi:DNA-binding beta-propeller fold protein YncE